MSQKGNGNSARAGARWKHLKIWLKSSTKASSINKTNEFKPKSNENKGLGALVGAID